MEYLVVSALGLKDQNIHTAITELVTDLDCFIYQAQGQNFASEHIFSALITGNWSNVAKLETALQTLASNLPFTLLLKRTNLQSNETPTLPYNVQVISLDQVGVVYNTCNFFTVRNIPVDAINTESYTSNATKARVLIINLSICIPAFNNLAELREQFLLFCDDLNMDGIIEPDKR